jgi:hypothetical protein
MVSIVRRISGPWVASLVLLCLPQVATAAERHYVPPITNAVVNETPYITTELRPIYMYHEIPGQFVTQGGRINLYAAQLRAAITKRLAFIATKDGWADVDFQTVLPDEEGPVNVAAGLKYALVDDEQSDSILTLGVRYEAPIGDIKTGGIRLQGHGDGLIDAFLTGAMTIGDRVGLQASVGANTALNMDHDSSWLHASVHADCELLPGLFAVIETNLIATFDEGTRTDSSAVGSFEGFDLVNFGSTDSGTVVTMGFGARYRVNDHLMFGAAYEVPTSDRKDIFDERVTIDAIIQL